MKEEPTKAREKAARQAETERYGYGSGDAGNSDESSAERREEGNFYCAAGASLRVPPNRSRAGSPRRSAGGARLVDFLC